MARVFTVGLGDGASLDELDGLLASAGSVFHRAP